MKNYGPEEITNAVTLSALDLIRFAGTKYKLYNFCFKSARLHGHATIFFASYIKGELSV